MECKPNSPTNVSSVAPTHIGTASTATDINFLPHELIQEILGHLPPSADISSRLVSKLWNKTVKELADRGLKVFGKEAWKEYYNYNVDGKVPLPPSRIYQISRSLRRHLKGERAAPLTCTLLLMPKGLTLNKLKELVQKPKKGNSTQFHKDSWSIIFDTFGDVPIEESYWFLITDDVIEGSRNKSYATKQVHVAKKAGFEYQVPNLLEVAVCSFMNHVSSGKYLFGRDPWNFTPCQEQIYGMQVFVGGFAMEGLQLCGFFFGLDNYGFAARRKFD